ncbi:hypothetical protein [Pelagibaculum spongiae]|uniref:Uncharacterized protein n=1 Tax=Pelagibaculum spongiae TaxID=2080658 RepID=A0A2V1H4Y2_9GAMM|nr:hypothetical protein [Pelagibaculum spongiae]PVZ72288.1 hypothetical protein DC094_04560 [Pelagibaculum spongiae]
MKREIRDRKNLEKYTQQMGELKERLEFLKSYKNTKKDRFLVENSALHVRKIVELFAFSLMSLQKDLYKVYRQNAGIDFLKDWNGRDILTKLISLNPDCYFKPIRRELMVKPNGVKEITFIDEKECYTVKRLGRLYERCGGVLHVTNPWKSCNKTESFHGELPSIIRKLVATFENQSILVNHWQSQDSTVVLVHLAGEAGKPSYSLAEGGGNFRFDAE